MAWEPVSPWHLQLCNDMFWTNSLIYDQMLYKYFWACSPTWVGIQYMQFLNSFMKARPAPSNWRYLTDHRPLWYILDPFKGLHNVLYKSEFQKPLVTHIWWESLVHDAVSKHLWVICCHSSCLKNVTVSRPCGLLEVNHNRASCTSQLAHLFSVQLLECRQGFTMMKEIWKGRSFYIPSL